jgi:hypothetical protein
MKTPAWTRYCILAIDRSRTQVRAVQVEDLAACIQLDSSYYNSDQPLVLSTRHRFHYIQASLSFPSQQSNSPTFVHNDRLTPVQSSRSRHIFFPARPCTKIRVSSKGFAKFSRALRARWRDKTSLEREAFFGHLRKRAPSDLAQPPPPLSHDGECFVIFQQLNTASTWLSDT